MSGGLEYVMDACTFGDPGFKILDLRKFRYLATKD